MHQDLDYFYSLKAASGILTPAVCVQINKRLATICPCDIPFDQIHHVLDYLSQELFSNRESIPSEIMKRLDELTVHLSARQEDVADWECFSQRVSHILHKTDASNAIRLSVRKLGFENSEA